MIKVDLVTGFLGSGKTTFITEYASYLVSKGINTAIIVNDYGAINVDRLLLEETLGDMCHLEMVIGGDPDCTRRRLKTKLIAMAMNGYKHVIVEPSGIFDVDDFFDLIFDESLERWYEIGSVISIVEAGLDTFMSEEGRYLLASQISKAGRVLISKSEDSSKEEIQRLKDYMNECLREFKCTREINDINLWKRGKISESEFKEIESAGYRSGEIIKLPISDVNSFDSLFYFHVRTNTEKDILEETIKGIFSDEKAGNVIRLKGFIMADSGEWMEINATKNMVDIKPITTGQELFIVIGEQLDEEQIGKHWDEYRNSL